MTTAPSIISDEKIVLIDSHFLYIDEWVTPRPIERFCQGRINNSKKYRAPELKKRRDFIADADLRL